MNPWEPWNSLGTLGNLGNPGKTTPFEKSRILLRSLRRILANPKYENSQNINSCFISCAICGSEFSTTSEEMAVRLGLRTPQVIACKWIWSTQYEHAHTQHAMTFSSHHCSRPSLHQSVAVLGVPWRPGEERLMHGPVHFQGPCEE